uniref:Prominin 2 n=1 Tax=Poecilia reticulata TaxID=8081 RepID=A0A3P9Q8B7_POERE
MWRWPYSGAVGTMLLLLLGSSSAQDVSAQLSCPAVEVAQNITQPQYNCVLNKNTDVRTLVSFVHSFLYTVQPHPFPERKPNYRMCFCIQILTYEVGFLVCIAIGILYIVLMPIIGFFVAFCRYCGKCGGNMYQKQTSSTNSLRRTLYFTNLSVCTFIAGNICMFRSNEDLKNSVNQSPLQLNNALRDMHTFLVSVPQVSENIRRSELAYFRVSESLTTRDQLDQLNSSLAQLQSSIDRTQANISVVRDRLTQMLSIPECKGCQNLTADMKKLTLNITISVSAVNTKFISTNISCIITKKKCFAFVFLGSKDQLSSIQKHLLPITRDLPLSALDDASKTIIQLQSNITTYFPEAEKLENIRWSVGLALCFVILLVVVCNILGLIVGLLGLSPKVDPTNRSMTSNCGGIFLMIAGFSFLFSWLFMILVLVLFPLGGNMHTLICRPWNNGQLLQFIDTPGLFPNFELGSTFGLKRKLNLSHVYRECKKNQPLWTTFYLYELIDLESALNVSKVSFVDEFEKTSITLFSVNILSPDMIKKLVNTSSKATDFNTTAPNDIKYGLQNESLKLRRSLLSAPQINLKSSIRNLQSSSEKINVSALTNTWTVFNFPQFTQHVGLCVPVARVVDSVDTVVCVNTVESLNAFWFSLGWCLMFLIPSIIFSMKLAKYYRRMSYSDVFENHIVMNHIPRAQMKIPLGCG